MDEEEKVVPDVDYVKSLRKQKLVYKRDLGYIIIDYIMTRGLFILFVIGFIYGGFEAWIIESNYVFLPLSILFLSWLVFSLIYINTLVEVQGQGIAKNKEDVMNTLTHFYDDLTFDASEENMIRDVKPTKWTSGRVLTVLLENDKVYFHKASLIRGSGISPISGWVDFMKSKKMAKYFKELQAELKTEQ